MKKIIKTFLLIVLSIVCLTGMTACDESSDSQIDGENQLVAGGLTQANYVNNSNAIHGNFEYYLKIDGVEGESKDSRHEKWTDVIDFSHASIQSIQTGSPDAAGRGVFEPITFTHLVDKGTPKIQEAVMKGSHIKVAELHTTAAINGKHEVIYKVKFEGIKLVKAEVRTVVDGEGQSYLVEEVSMLVNKMTWTVTPIGLDNMLGGSTEASFDQTKKC